MTITCEYRIIGGYMFKNVNLLVDAEIKAYQCKQNKRSILTYVVVTCLLCLLLIALPFIAKADNWTDEQIANAIYKAENSKRYPYGIKSINTYGNAVYARKICLNTIRNNRKRFTKQTKYKDFLEFLGSRYCPTTIKSEYHLNKNWVRLVKYFLERGC